MPTDGRVPGSAGPSTPSAVRTCSLQERFQIAQDGCEALGAIECSLVLLQIDRNPIRLGRCGSVFLVFSIRCERQDLALLHFSVELDVQAQLVRGIGIANGFVE